MATTTLLVTLTGVPYTIQILVKPRSLVLDWIPKKCADSLLAIARSSEYTGAMPALHHLGVRAVLDKEQKLRKKSLFEIFIKQTQWSPEVILLSGIVGDIDYVETTF